MTRSETKTFFKVFEGIDPGDEFVLIVCDYVPIGIPATMPPCPTGYTCTTTGPAMPSVGRSCYTAESGNFVGDDLVVICGSESIQRSSTGVETQGGGHYTHVELRRR